MMDVTALGPARILHSSGFKAARNLINRFDPVPLCDPIGLIHGISDKSLHYLPTTGCPLKDHLYESRNFTSKRDAMGTNFKTRYGEVL